tara:strand:+ start:2470 stop:2754 length:285 start_codon:yes stop_codon:yes gene_type:complete
MEINKCFNITFLLLLILFVFFISKKNDLLNYQNLVINNNKIVEGFEPNDNDRKQYRTINITDEILNKDKYIRSYGSTLDTTSNMFTETESIFYN